MYFEGSYYEVTFKKIELSPVTSAEIKTDTPPKEEFKPTRIPTIEINNMDWEEKKDTGREQLR